MPHMVRMRTETAEVRSCCSTAFRAQGRSFGDDCRDCSPCQRRGSPRRARQRALAADQLASSGRRVCVQHLARRALRGKLPTDSTRLARTGQQPRPRP